MGDGIHGTEAGEGGREEKGLSLWYHHWEERG